MINWIGGVSTKSRCSRFSNNHHQDEYYYNKYGTFKIIITIVYGNQKNSDGDGISNGSKGERTGEKKNTVNE